MHAPLRTYLLTLVGTASLAAVSFLLSLVLPQPAGRNLEQSSSGDRYLMVASRAAHGVTAKYSARGNTTRALKSVRRPMISR